MVYRQISTIKFAAVLLALAAFPPIAVEWSSRSTALAQSFGENPASFPIPSSLPEGAELRVDGSTSMRLTNEALEGRFEAQFPDVDVQLDASRTDNAIEALLANEIDLVATGRPLTEAEESQGLVEVALPTREKLAIILGPENTFNNSDLTFDQFASIFRGEITNWSEVGGPDLPIRVVDRPDYSDTRRALSTYTVFEGQPFATGSTAAPVDADETDAVIESLGTDGIGYAVYSQVEGRDDVRIIAMHQTFPDDPRYPYSQYRAYVANEDASPAVQAFLGFATTEPGQEVIGTAPADAESAELEPAPVAADADAPDADVTDPEVVESVPADVEPADPAAADVDEDTTALVPSEQPAAEVEGGAFPWWLLAIPVVGGLLWWFLRGTGGSAPAAAGGAAVAPPVVPPVVPPIAPKVDPRLVLTPRDSQNAYAYWEISDDRMTQVKRQGGEDMRLRLYDVTETDRPLPDPIREFDCDETQSDQHLPIPQSDRDYVAEVGYLSADKQWLPIAKSNSVRVPAAPTEASPNLTVPNLKVPEADIGGATKVPGIALGGAVAAGAAAIGAAGLMSKTTQQDTPTADSHSRVVMTPRNDKKAYAYWEIPEAARTSLKAQGGKDCQLRIYDVTNVTDGQPPHTTLTYDVDETDCDRFIPLPEPDRDYVAELGYSTDDGGWLTMARSAPMQANTILEPVSTEVASAEMPTIPAVPNTADAPMVPDAASSTVAGKGPNLTAAVAGGTAAAVGGLAAAAAAGQQLTGKLADEVGSAVQGKATTVAPGTVELVTTSDREAQVTWEVPEAARAAAKRDGGQQYQLRIYDATNIDQPAQSPRLISKYPCSEVDNHRTIPLPQVNRAYLAEMGYEVPGDRWLMLARSTPVELPSSDSSRGDGSDASSGLGAVAGAVGAAGVAAATVATSAAKATEKATEKAANLVKAAPPVPSACAIKSVTVNGRHHAFKLDEGQLQSLRDVAVTYPLERGTYIVCIRNGGFNYGDTSQSAEPLVLLWISGGTAVNLKTGVPSQSAMTTLNGYADTLTLDVQQPATLHAFFFDTNPYDNTEEATLAVVQL